MKAETDSEKDFFDFKCPYCRKAVSFPREWMGTVQQCLWCSADIVVPESSKQTPREFRLDIQTNRLVFRRLKDTDRNDLLELLSDSDSLIYSGFRTLDAEEVENWLVKDARIKSCMDLDNAAFFAIELPIESKLIALVAFDYRSEEFRNAGFDLVVNRQFRRQGYGTEIVRGVLAFAFDEANLHRVTVSCNSENIAGLKMLARAGMRREGEFIESRFWNGKWVNLTLFSILQREWKPDGSE